MPRIRIEAGKFVVEGRDVAGLRGRGVGVVEKKEMGRRQMRWKDGSFLTEQQVVGEGYDKIIDLEQRRLDPL